MLWAHPQTTYLSAEASNPFHRGAGRVDPFFAFSFLLPLFLSSSPTLSPSSRSAVRTRELLSPEISPSDTPGRENQKS